MPLRRLVVAALVAGAMIAFLGALLRPRVRPDLLGTREEVEAQEEASPGAPRQPLVLHPHDPPAGAAPAESPAADVLASGAGAAG